MSRLTHENIVKLFAEAADFNSRDIICCGRLIHTYAIDGLTSGRDISEFVFKPLLENLRGESMKQLYSAALNDVVVNAVARPCEDLQKAASFLVNGFCLVLFDGVGAIAFEAKTGEKRSISPPDLENTTKGPKDAFVETVRSNTSLVRRHLRTPELRIYETAVGQRSLTNVAVVWIDGLTNPEYVCRMKDRLANIDIDGLVSPAAVEEYITGSRATAFPLLQYTERTDRFCRGLLQGRVGLFADGIPVGYLAPVDIGYLMDSPEDVGRDYISASCVRVLRYTALLISLLLPAIFIAMTTFHVAWIPQPLRDVIMSSKASVPFSSMWEVLGLLVAFELLQESGVHLPQSIGQSVSIIGGIVVGTAGVEAGVISPVALITVSLAGVCGFALPNRDMATAIRVWRFVLAIGAAVVGLTGVGLVLLYLLVHLARLKSLGVSYLVLFEPGLLRHRLKFTKYRSKRLKVRDRRNQK